MPLQGTQKQNLGFLDLHLLKTNQAVYLLFTYCIINSMIGSKFLNTSNVTIAPVFIADTVLTLGVEGQEDVVSNDSGAQATRLEFAQRARRLFRRAVNEGSVQISSVLIQLSFTITFHNFNLFK